MSLSAGSTFLTAPSIEARKERWRRLLASEAGPGFVFHVNCRELDRQLPEAPPYWPDRIPQRIEYAKKLYEHQAEAARWLHDDRIPHLSIMTSTEIFAEALGCDVRRPKHTNPFALPRIQSADQVDQLTVPELSHSTLAPLLEMANELHDFSGGQVPLRMVDVQSPLDIVALVWDKADLFIAMMEDPPAVQQAVRIARQLMADFFDEWFQRFGTEFVAHYPAYFMDGGITLSEDEIGSLSPAMFDQYVLDELAWLSDRYGGIGIHCCADARHQWPGLARVPGLKLLNLNCPPTRKPEEYINEAYRFFADVAAQMHIGWNPPISIAEQTALAPRLILEFSVETGDEAKALCDTLNAMRSDLATRRNISGPARNHPGSDCLDDAE